MNCPRCSVEVERVWTGKKTVMVEPGRVTVYVPGDGNGSDVFLKSTNGRIAHKCRADRAPVERGPEASEPQGELLP